MQITDNWFLSYFYFLSVMTSLEQIPRNFDKHKDDSNMCFILLSLRPFYISLHSTN